VYLMPEHEGVPLEFCNSAKEN